MQASGDASHRGLLSTAFLRDTLRVAGELGVTQLPFPHGCCVFTGNDGRVTKCDRTVWLQEDAAVSSVWLSHRVLQKAWAGERWATRNPSLRVRPAPAAHSEGLSPAHSSFCQWNGTWQMKIGSDQTAPGFCLSPYSQTLPMVLPTPNEDFILFLQGLQCMTLVKAFFFFLRHHKGFSSEILINSFLIYLSFQ